MGLDQTAVEGLVREHTYKPITGDVVLVGRLTIDLTPTELLALFREHGLHPECAGSGDVRLDVTTRHPDKAGRPLIANSEIFRLFGARSIRALDQSPYEGAELIHDLNEPVPAQLEGCADFIVDGGVTDNVWDPALTLLNYARMLRPGGRLYTANMLSNHHEPYCMLPPLWYMDYFCINGFSDVKCYVVVQNGPLRDVFTINYEHLADPERHVAQFRSNHIMNVVVFAEKGPGHTTERSPIQQHDRSPAAWQDYRGRLNVIMKSNRPHLIRSRNEISFFDVVAGHNFISKDFVECDPMTEIRRIHPPDVMRKFNIMQLASWLRLLRLHRHDLR